MKPGETNITITLSKVFKRFDDVTALEDINVVFEAGTLTTLLGPSGCGKTTLLNLLGALDTPTAGKIQRPSNGEAPTKVAFVQCAGSRDVKHLPYCSAICCMASLKQAPQKMCQVEST